MSGNYRYNRNCCCNKCCNDIMPKAYEGSCNDIQEDVCMYNPKYGKDECSCGFDEYIEDNGLPRNPILAQAYVPIQQIGKTYIPSVGLRMGTIFPELVRPYVPNQSIMVRDMVAAGNVIREGCNYGM